MSIERRVKRIEDQIRDLRFRQLDQRLTTRAWAMIAGLVLGTSGAVSPGGL